MSEQKVNSKKECLRLADHWLNKAVEYEADPTKSEKLHSLAFDKALRLENDAHDGRP